MMSPDIDPGTASNALRAYIREAGGSVAFDEFMRWALYDSEHGYYTRRVRTVGREGDFSTSATLHPALGEAIARWAWTHRRDGMTAGGNWHLIELGGGNGELAAGVLGSLGWWARRQVRYHVVDVSAGLRATQKARLEGWGGRVTWHETLADALDAAGGAALIVSSEFVDAFPCARWVDDGGWRELRVAWPNASAQAIEVIGELVPAVELARATVPMSPGLPDLSPGQRVEIFASYRVWQREQFTRWTRGRLLTIDYGDELPALYRRRPSGTLRAYCQQMRFVGNEVYARPGQQDLTADVNFTDLKRWGEEMGLVTASYTTQADFLGRWLSRRQLRGANGDARLAYLLDTEGAGGAFKVLEQTRGVSRLRPSITAQEV